MVSKSLLIGMLIVPLVLAVALPPVAAHMGRGSMTRLSTELGLSDIQIQAIRQLHQDQRPARVQLHQSLRDARRSLRDLVFSGGADAAIQAQVGQVQQLEAQAVQMRVDTLRAMSQILTPEQREKYRQFQPTRH
jgi:periplasmic protein CpxP/Spy